jgi:hypothetical protein
VKVRSTINVDKARDTIYAGAAKGLTLAAEAWLTEANLTVPHDEGTLERSGEASVDEAELRAAVSYDTPYAVRQHEDMTLSHDGKGQAKWLENTGTQMADTLAQIIATACRSEVEG